MLQNKKWLNKATENLPPSSIKEIIPENKEEKISETIKLQPTAARKETTSQNLRLVDKSVEINLLHGLMNSPDILNEIIKLSQMMLESKIDFEILEFIKRGINTEYDDSTTLISVAAFHKYWKHLVKPEVAKLEPKIEDKILKFIITQDDQKVDKNKLFTLIDFYQYYPVYTQKDQNLSNKINLRMNSGTKGDFQNKGQNKINIDKFKQNKELIYLWEYITNQLKEKYSNILNAF